MQTIKKKCLKLSNFAKTFSDHGKVNLKVSLVYIFGDLKNFLKLL